MRLYKRKWVNAGIAYRRSDLMIIKPDAGNPNWLVRLVHGDAGEQKDENERTFTKESKAFRYANRVIRRKNRIIRKANKGLIKVNV